MSASVATLSQLFVYPVKSAAGIPLNQAQVTPQGLEHDRRWMVVDATGMLVTQRERPELAHVETAVVGEYLKMTAPGMSSLEVPLNPLGGHPVTVTMWTEPVAACLVTEATEWFSTFLDGLYRLVYMPQSTRRLYPGRDDTLLSFADGNPFLLISEASLSDLNTRLDKPVDLRNFRPNLVVSGCSAFAEDAWDTVQIGQLRLQRLGPCVRCMLVNVDPETAIRQAEPLKTLARYRRIGHEVHFGQLYRPVDGFPATLLYGDPIVILDEEVRGAA